MNRLQRKNKTCAVIPFFNEERYIKEIVERTLDYVDLIVCIDDGSNDNSVKLIPENDRIIVLKNDINRGKGFSLRKGFEKSIELKTGFTIALDSDLQHPPELIPAFIEKLKDFDIVIGNRMNDTLKMPFQRILSNRITSGLLSIKTKTRVPDSQCGFRGFRTGILNSILPSSEGYEAESEMIVKAAGNNLKIGFADIPALYNLEQSKMRAVKTIIGFIKVLFK